MTIHENLRRLRQKRAMTQEQAAQHLGVTRQALSGYELGRTRLDIDTLMRLADIYEVQLDTILYGSEQEEKAARRMRAAALALAAVLGLLTLASSALLWSANYFFPVPTGQLTQEEMHLIATHFKLTQSWQTMDSVILSLSLPGFLLLPVLYLTSRATIPVKTILLYAAALAGVLLVLPLPFALSDPVFSPVNYMVTPLLVTGRLAVVLAIVLMAAAVQKRRKRLC